MHELEVQIESRLSSLMKMYLHEELDHDSRISVDGEMRGLGYALGVIRGTSSMTEVLDAQDRDRISGGEGL